MTFLTELERLKGAATKGPLTLDDCNADDLQRPNRFAGPVVVYSDSDCETHPVADFSCNHTCRDSETAQANAALHVFLVNHADALAGLVRAASSAHQTLVDEGFHAKALRLGQAIAELNEVQNPAHQEIGG